MHIYYAFLKTVLITVEFKRVGNRCFNSVSDFRDSGEHFSGGAN